MTKENPKVTVIDSIMGSGKTQAMYQFIRNNPETSFMVVTPYLKTIQDAKSAGIKIFEPNHCAGGKKLDSLKELLMAGKNIICTHALFLAMDDEATELVEKRGYTLFIDEVLDVLRPINDLIEDPNYNVRPGAATFLIEQRIIAVDERCRVEWVGLPCIDSGLDYEYKELEKLIDSGNVLCPEEEDFYWVFPEKVLKAFQSVYVLTYLFKGSVFDGYLRMSGLGYSLGGVSGPSENGKAYLFGEYKTDVEQRKELSKHIMIYEGKGNNVGNGPGWLSYSWYSQKATKKDFEAMKKGLNTFRVWADRKSDGHTGLRMWTTFKAYEKKFKGASAFTFTRKLTEDEARRMKEDCERKDPELNKLRCFVPCNTKATNDYIDRSVLAYLVNRYYNPRIVRMFRSCYQIKLNDKQCALSELLQWIWRSSIRNENALMQSGGIKLYIPSSRVRKLFKEWLNGKDL